MLLELAYLIIYRTDFSGTLFSDYEENYVFYFIRKSLTLAMSTMLPKVTYLTTSKKMHF